MEKWVPWRVENEDSTVGVREGHGACCLTQRLQSRLSTTLVVSGGYCSSSDQEDIFGCPVPRKVETSHDDMAALSWTLLGRSDVFARDGFTLCEVPLASYTQQADCDACDIAIGFGGVTSDCDVTNDLFILLLTPTGDHEDNAACVSIIDDARHDDSGQQRPSSRCRHAATLQIMSASQDQDRVLHASVEMIIFGGEEASGEVTNSLWMMQSSFILTQCPDYRQLNCPCFNIKEMHVKWVPLEATSPPPPLTLSCVNFASRGHYDSRGLRSQLLIIYGGATYDGIQLRSVNSCWCLKLADNDDVHGEVTLYTEAFELATNAPMPAVNGHIGFVVARDNTQAVSEMQKSSGNLVYFSGKCFDVGNDEVHVLYLSQDSGEKSIGMKGCYTKRECPFAPDEYCRNDGAGGVGVGVWPHWRFTSSLGVTEVDAEQERTLMVFLTAGQSRHEDVAPVYRLCWTSDFLQEGSNHPVF